MDGDGEGFLRHRVDLKSNAKAYLEKLVELGIPIAAATSSDRDLVIPALKRNGIFDMFHSVVTVRDVTR